MDSAIERGNGRFVRFILVGGSNFFLGLLLFQAAWLAGGPLGALRTPAAQALAYAIGMAWSFFWSRKWVFRTSDGSAARVRGEALRFAISQILCLLISIFLVTAAIDGIGLPPLLGWLAAMTPLVLLNFYLSSRWVFRMAKPRSLARPARPIQEGEHS